MGSMIELVAADGHRLGAYRARPGGTPRAGIVVLQEVFGLTEHIRRVADGFAARGFLAVAPALFDRVGPDIRLDYADVARGRDTMMALDIDASVRDMAAAVDAAREPGRVAAIGYCWGGAMADLAACRLDVDAAVSYYGRRTVEWLDERPRCPVLYHFGGQDPLIPPDLVEAIRAGRPDGIFFEYPQAGHGFNCSERADYHGPSADLALARTLDFLEDALGR